MSKLWIVSNRLPVTVAFRDDGLHVGQSVGGLATGMASFYEERDCEWIGWPGVADEQGTDADRDAIRQLLADRRCVPIFLSEQELDEYYKGFCNQTVWPLCHYFPTYAEYQDRYWEAYVAVNERFRDAIIDRAGPEDTIWVHDYHLFLLPGLLRERLPEAKIGFFLHIPFPSSEIVRLLPWREELLNQLLGADLIGFHTYDYVRHFLASVSGVLGHAPIAAGKTVIPVGRRLVRTDAFPMGIDFGRFERLSRSEEAEREVKRIRDDIGDRRVIVSIDRLDYSKGMLQRLGAFERFLEEHPEQHRKVTLVLKAIASRSGIAQYDRLKRRLDEAVGRVNGRFGTLDWAPVWYLFRFLPEETLVALYKLADVALLTPLRDGMNLIAKEFLAAKTDEDGVLILSELAGAAHELQEALIVNPNDERQISRAISEALEMPDDEQRIRCRRMRERIERTDVVHWAREFIDALDETKRLQERLTTGRLAAGARRDLVAAYRSADTRLLAFDYDGTLTELAARPERAAPTEGILSVLGDLAEAPGNDVAVFSGRRRERLDTWFGGLPVRLVAEHGVWTRDPDGEWHQVHLVTTEWKDEIRPMVELYARRTPGSRLEEKEYSLVWDYRATKREFAEVRSAELLADLNPMLQTHHLDVLRGAGYLELKSAGISESTVVAEWVAEGNYAFVLCAGDDMSDEDVFAVLPEDAYTIRIGPVPSRARFSLTSPAELIDLLHELAS